MRSMAQTQVPIALTFSVLIFLISISHAARSTPPPSKLKAVNLGGWLVTEGWIKPSLFDAIPNNDLLVITYFNFFISNLQINSNSILIFRMVHKSSSSQLHKACMFVQRVVEVPSWLPIEPLLQDGKHLRFEKE